MPEVLTTTALADADAALASDDVRRRAAEDSRRRAAEMEAMLSGDARRADLDALRHSLATLGWAWSRQKRDLAASLLKEAEEIPGVPKAHVAKLARTLVDEVDYAIETTRQRVSRDPAHDWLERAQVDGMADLAHQATRFITEMDGDMATVRNSAGWGRSHTHAGHVLAAEPVLSAIQASQALSAIFRHRKQLPAALRRELFGDE